MENKVIKAGTKIVINTFASIGAETSTAYILTQDYTDDELSDIAWQEGVQYAESYGIYPMSDLESMSKAELEELEELEESGDIDDYSDSIEGWWELYDSDKHDGHLIYGSNQGFKFHEL